MLTLAELTTGEGAPLRSPTTELPADNGTRIQMTTQVIEQVEACDANWRLHESGTRIRNALAVVPAASQHLAADPQPALRALKDGGAVAVAIATPQQTPHVAPGLLEAARQVGLPLLVSAAPCTAPDLFGRLLRCQLDALRADTEQRDRLLELSTRLDRQGEGPGPLLSWLSDQTASRITVITERDSTGWTDLAEHGQVLERLIAGQMHSAAVETGGRHVRLHAIGSEAPHHVLAAVRETPWPRHLSKLVDRAAGLVALLQHPLALRAQARRLEHSAAAVKVSTLQYLMAGDVVQAARAIEPWLPGLLTADACQVVVVECAPGEERAAVAKACDTELEGRALVVMCPAEDAHVIVVCPRTEDAGEDAVERLRPVVAAHPDRAAGASRPVEWTEVERAYTAAVQALTTARRQPDRIHTDDGAAPLAHRLSPAARAWAAALLAPLEKLPPAERKELADTARLGLALGPSKAARLIGRAEVAEATRLTPAPHVIPDIPLPQSEGTTRLHRNTVSKKLSRVMELVGLDRSRLADRAVLDLALQLDTLPPAPPGTPIPTLEEVLAEDAARAWEAELLAPLTGSTATRDETDGAVKQLGLLATWAEHNGHAGDTAEALRIHRNTATARLGEVASTIGRPLTEPGRGQHEAYLALCIGETIPLDTLPTPALSPPGCGELTDNGVPVHGEPSASSAATASRRHGAPHAPSTARVYNAVGGGKDNYGSDAEIARRITELWPQVGRAVQENRAFIHRTARRLASEAGIRQFLDIGTGIPHPVFPHLHQTVQGTDPTARVLYVDNDPMVLAHATALLTSTPEGRTGYLDADVTDPDSILRSRELADTLDLDRPVALYLCALLHLLRDDQDPWGITRRLTDALAPGSYVVLTHATHDFAPDLMAKITDIYNSAGRGHIYGTSRSRAEIARMIEGLELLEPGIVAIHRWRPDDTGDLLPDSQVNCYGLVARKA